jgi:hypothetical protein
MQERKADMIFSGTQMTGNLSIGYSDLFLLLYQDVAKNLEVFSCYFFQRALRRNLSLTSVVLSIRIGRDRGKSSAACSPLSTR